MTPNIPVVQMPHARGLPLPAYETALAAGMDLRAAVDEDVAWIGGDMARMKEGYRVLGVTDAHCRMALDEPDDAARAAVARVVGAHA